MHKLNWLTATSIRYPKLTVIAGLLVVLALSPGLLRLELRTDGHALVPVDADELLVDALIREQFHVGDQVVIVIKSDDARGIFNPFTLQLVDRLTEQCQRLPYVGLGDVFSLATERGHRVKPGTLNFRRFLDPMPTTSVELIRLRDDLRAIKLYNGTLISADEESTVVMVTVPADADRAKLLSSLSDLVKSNSEGPELLSIIGAPVAEAQLGLHLLEDLGVPSAFINAGSRGEVFSNAISRPRSLDELRMLIGTRIGLVPLAIFAMFLVFLVAFRSLIAALLPLMEVGAGLLFVFAIMGWLDVPIYLTIAVLPIILTAIGIADEVHIFTRYRKHLSSDCFDNHIESVRATMYEMGSPVVKTSLTTAIGFLSFTLSSMAPVRAFGAFTSLGIVFFMIWSLSVIPASLILCPKHWFVSRTASAKASVLSAKTDWFERLTQLGIERSRAVVIAAGIVVLLAPIGLWQLRVQDSWINGFAKNSTFYKAVNDFNSQFLGMHILQIEVRKTPSLIAGMLTKDALNRYSVKLPGDMVTDSDSLIGQRIRLHRTNPRRNVSPLTRRPVITSWDSWIQEAQREGDKVVVNFLRNDGPPGMVLHAVAGEKFKVEILDEPFLSPRVLNAVESFQNYLESLDAEAVGGVMGTADYIKTTNLMSRGLKEESRVIPERSDKIEWLWQQYRKIRGTERLQQAVSRDFGASLQTVYLKNANFVDTARLIDKIRAYESAHLEPEGLSLQLAGDVAVSQALIGAIVTTQIESLLLSLIGIAGVTIIMGRSLIWGILCVLPCALAVLINFSMMGLTGIPLGVATSMFAGMTLGIGVDYAIHLLESLRQSQETGLEGEAALCDAVRATAPAITIDAIAVGLGFGLLTFSQVPANTRLGLLVVLSMVSCLMASLLLIPAILNISRRG